MKPDGRAPLPTLLGAARIGLGTLFLVRTTGLAAAMSLFPAGGFLLGWPDAGGPGVGALVPLPGALVAVACLLRTAAAALFTAGVWTRPAGVTAGLLGYLVATQDPLGLNMTLHTLFLATVVLGMGDAGSRLALRPTAASSPRSGTGLVRIWIASIYVWAGIAKLHADWMSGRVLDALVHEGALGGPVTARLLATSGGRARAAVTVAVGEILLGPLLLFRPTRRAAVVVALGMHAVFQVAVSPDLLGWVMAILLVTFVGDIGPWNGVFSRVSRA